VFGSHREYISQAGTAELAGDCGDEELGIEEIIASARGYVN
jgi:tetrahydromethanopterin S-methyltransferase subunit A